MKSEVLYAEHLLTGQSNRQNLDYISFSITQGEILGITGLNDSGITALADVLTGRLHLRSGTIYYRGEPVTIRSREQANSLGIYEISHKLSVIPTLSVSENLNVLRRFAWKDFFVKRQFNQNITRTVFETYQIQGDPEGSVQDLTNAQRIELSICRAILCGAQLLVCRDVCEGFSEQELVEFTHFLYQLRDEGFSILMFNSNVSMLLRFADRVAIMRKGMICYSRKKAEISLKDIYQHLQIPLVSSVTTQISAIRHNREPIYLEKIQGLEDPKRIMSMKIVPGQAIGLLWGNHTIGSQIYRVFSRHAPAVGKVTEGSKTFLLADWLSQNRYRILCLGLRFWEVGLFENLTVAENLLLRTYRRYNDRGGVLNMSMLDLAIREFAASRGINLAWLYLYPRHLPPELRERIVLWGALFDPPKLLVLDNPLYTADENIRRDIMAAIEELKSAGTAILWSNNNSVQLRAYCDQVVMMPYDGTAGCLAASE